MKVASVVSRGEGPANLPKYGCIQLLARIGLKNSARRVATIFGPVEALPDPCWHPRCPMGNCELIRGHFRLQLVFQRLEMQGKQALCANDSGALETTKPMAVPPPGLCFHMEFGIQSHNERDDRRRQVLRALLRLEASTAASAILFSTVSP
jgi:hypothetical protein